MIDKLILLATIILLFIGVVCVFLARELVRKKKNIDNENMVVRNIKILGFVVIVISLLTVYFCKLGGV